ncbi:MAG: hypothetical protein U0798_01055 [Gemmataceae bacterium]
MNLPATPEWLKIRDGQITGGLRSDTVYISVAGRPQYRLDARPAKNQFVCSVTQTVNGKRLDDKDGYPTAEAALIGGLDQLRTKLGW